MANRSMNKFTIGAGDITLAGGLLSSPVWAGWLADINELLTSFTLIIGILIALVRLWVAWREQRREMRERKKEASPKVGEASP
jgi:hypothetical protein